MTHSWPHGVTSYNDMESFVEMLFGNCQMENLLTNTPWDHKSKIMLVRVKKVGDKCDWSEWPTHVVDAMDFFVNAHHRPDVIQCKGRLNGPRSRLYDTLQVTPRSCNCRVPFGGDKHIKMQTSSSACHPTQRMDKSLMEKLDKQDIKWDAIRKTKPGQTRGYHQKAFHLVLNRYLRDDGIDAHQDKSPTYHIKNPIVSLSFGRGSILTIEDSQRPEKNQQRCTTSSLVTPLSCPGP